MEQISRRGFIKTGTAFAVGMSLYPDSASGSTMQQGKVKIGIVGTGNRGTSLLRTLLSIESVDIVALCDLDESRALNAAILCGKSGSVRPNVYGRTVSAYKTMLDREKLDALIIATYWDSHTSIALDAMNRGVYPGIEVPAALTVTDTWQLVETSEKTGVPCMMLENWSFRNDNLALLNMKRRGIFGEIVHCHCAHSHDCIDHWFFDKETGQGRWPAEYLLTYNRDQYPTHSVGPVLSWMDINRGDIFTEIYSTATASKGINSYFRRKFGEDHPNAKVSWKQGDIVTSTLKTKMGKTLVINYDMQLPRPYSNRWLLQGTKGVYDEEKNSIYLIDQSPDYHTWNLGSLTNQNTNTNGGKQILLHNHMVVPIM